MVAGNRTMTAREVKHLIDADPTGKALRDYSAGKSLLHCTGTGAGIEISFKSSYQKKHVRFAWQLFYFTGYMMCFIATFTPLIVPGSGVFGDVDPLAAVALGCMTFLPISFVTLREGSRIAKAEKLVTFLKQSLRDKITLQPAHR